VARLSSSLANRRVVAGYTQEGLAEALGVDRTTVGRWERAEQRPHPWQRPYLARLLRITLEQLDGLLPTAQRPGADVPVSGSLQDFPTACQR
jgi:transcriptional regulator with XRE-family HTH domain